MLVVEVTLLDHGHCEFEEEAGDEGFGGSIPAECVFDADIPEDWFILTSTCKYKSYDKISTAICKRSDAMDLRSVFGCSVPKQ